MPGGLEAEPARGLHRPAHGTRNRETGAPAPPAWTAARSPAELSRPRLAPPARVGERMGTAAWRGLRK